MVEFIEEAERMLLTRWSLWEATIAMQESYVIVTNRSPLFKAAWVIVVGAELQ